jgi:ketosteroid isomerase-like protein
MSGTGEHADVVLALRAAQEADDRDAMRSLVTGDVTLHVPGHHQTARDYVGVDGLIEFAAASRATGASIVARDVVDVLEGQHHVAVYCHIRGRRPDREDLDNLTLHLYRVEDGRVAEIWFHNRDQAAVDAFWG